MYTAILNFVQTKPIIKLYTEDSVIGPFYLYGNLFWSDKRLNEIPDNILSTFSINFSYLITKVSNLPTKITYYNLINFEDREDLNLLIPVDFKESDLSHIKLLLN
jgi:hypothetical protein